MEPALPEALRIRDWTGLICWPIYVYDQAYPVAGVTYTGVGKAYVSAWLLRSGSVTVTAGGRATTARTGEWIIPLLGEHTSRFSDDASVLSVRFQANWPNGRPLLPRTKTVVLPEKSSRQLTRLAKCFERFATRNFIRADTAMNLKHASAEQYLKLNQHFFAWLSELVERMRIAGSPPVTPATADERALRAAHYLTTIPLHQPWTLQSLATWTGLSPAHLTRLFVEAFQTTPKLYYQERQKRAAQRLLREEQLPIKQAAHSLGFTSPSYFTAWFRSHFGVTPLTWQKNAVLNKDRPV